MEYILALLNSRLLSFWYINYFRSLKQAGGYLNFSKKEIKKIPLKKTNVESIGAIVDTANRIIAITKSDNYLKDFSKQAKVKEHEHQIDQMVYKLYDLTSEEIKIVEESVK